MTIYDIAKIAGVSASTVSRVINNRKGVNAETRRRVMHLLDEYDFKPDVLAQGLVNQSSRLIGIVMSDIRTLHHAEGTYYIEKHLREYGYSCLLVNAGISGQSRRESIRNLLARRVEAIAMIGSTFQDEATCKIIESLAKDMPIVIENGYLDFPNVYGVIADEKGGVIDCVRLLSKKGRIHPAYVNGNPTPSNRLKSEGYIDGLSLCYPSLSPVVIECSKGADEWKQSYDATLSLMKKYPRTDSIIYATDLLATAGIRCLQDLGITIPGQVAVIGIDNSVYAKITNPTITSLDNKLCQASQYCADTLVRVLNGEDIPKKLMIFSDIVEREST